MVGLYSKSHSSPALEVHIEADRAAAREDTEAGKAPSLDEDASGVLGPVGRTDDGGLGGPQRLSFASFDKVGRADRVTAIAFRFSGLKAAEAGPVFCVS